MFKCWKCGSLKDIWKPTGGMDVLKCVQSFNGGRLLVASGDCELSKVLILADPARLITCGIRTNLFSRICELAVHPFFPPWVWLSHWHSKKKKKFSAFKIIIATCQEHIIVSRIHQKNTSREISLQYLIILPHRHLWGRCLKAMRLSFKFSVVLFPVWF